MKQTYVLLHRDITVLSITQYCHSHTINIKYVSRILSREKNCTGKVQNELQSARASRACSIRTFKIEFPPIWWLVARPRCCCFVALLHNSYLRASHLPECKIRDAYIYRCNKIFFLSMSSSSTTDHKYTSRIYRTCIDDTNNTANTTFLTRFQSGNTSVDGA